jgi:hypothetical protein
MRVVRVFTDEFGESHFEERDTPMEDVAYGRASQHLRVSALIFRETEPGGTLDFHNPPRRQFIISCEGRPNSKRATEARDV